MSRIAQAFQNGKAFIPFVTGGDPDLETTQKLLVAMQEAGADLIEIGLPFSDPIAEGVVIQEANERALAAGCTTDKLFDMVKRARQTVTVPMVFLTYINPIFTYGKEKFMKRCVECGIDGLICLFTNHICHLFYVGADLRTHTSHTKRRYHIDKSFCLSRNHFDSFF